MPVGADNKGSSECEFTGWAPFRDSVSLRVLSPGERALTMVKDRSGYWKTAAAGVEPGVRYVFTLDGETDRPDPASHFQPEGVHGPLEVVGHREFPWQDHGWQGIPLEQMVICDLHVGTFTPEGTFDAALSRLDELSRMGINAVEIMPVAQFPGERNWGYDGAYLYAVQSSYGGPAGIDHLRAGAHYALSSLFTEYEETESIYTFTATTLKYDRLEMGRQKAATGRISVRSNVTGESTPVDFAVLHLGDHNFAGGAGYHEDGGSFSETGSKIREAFTRGDIPEVMRLINVRSHPRCGKPPRPGP